jgi:hypothetical protein
MLVLIVVLELQLLNVVHALACRLEGCIAPALSQLHQLLMQH